MRVAKLAAATVALTAAAVVATTGSASAAVEPPGNGWDHTFRATGIVVYVEEHGDIVSVCDTAANGKAARLEVWTADNFLLYKAAATKGKGSCVTHKASQGGNYDLPEGRKIDLLLRGDSGAFKTKQFLNDH